MIKVTFKAKKIKIGTSQGFVIPSGIANILEDEKKYQITIDEAKDEENNTNIR